LGRIYRRAKEKGIEATGILTGDVFDPNSFERFNDLKPGENKILITVNGVLTNRRGAKELLDSVQAFDVGTRRVAAQNGNHGLRDFVQILINESHLPDLAALRLAQQIDIAANALRKSGAKNPTIVVVAHSQGTMTFMRALQLLDPRTKAMIEFYGNGGQIFVPNDIGLKRAVNFLRENDLVARPANSNLRPIRRAYALRHTYEVYEIGRGGRGWPLDIDAHYWKDNYQQLYENKGGLRLPPGSNRVNYPKRLLPH
jgi:hypothetical protein